MMVVDDLAPVLRHLPQFHSGSWFVFPLVVAERQDTNIAGMSTLQSLVTQGPMRAMIMNLQVGLVLQRIHDSSHIEHVRNRAFGDHTFPNMTGVLTDSTGALCKYTTMRLTPTVSCISFRQASTTRGQHDRTMRTN